MTAGNVAGFVREHTDQLVRCFRPHDQPRVDELVLTARNKGIELFVPDEIDVERGWLEPGRLPDRRYHSPDVGLDLGVADEGFGRGNWAGDGETPCEDDRHRAHVTSRDQWGRFQRAIGTAWSAGERERPRSSAPHSKIEIRQRRGKLGGQRAISSPAR
jgi:hypothetical protein